MIGVIEQLEKTGNRPHLIKELATVLSTTSEAVLRYVVEGWECYHTLMADVLTLYCSSSANPSALLSSRLSAYLRRPEWTALSPCPLGKELIPVHPRKVFYFLTTLPRQQIPDNSSNLISPHALGSLGSGGKGGKRIISPSLSNASIDEDVEGAEDRKRDALSPSPEVDLSIPELDMDPPGHEDDFNNPPTPVGSSFSGRSSLARDGTSVSSERINLVHNHRAASPPLEGDEKEFTQTASSMRMRGMNLDEMNIRESTETENSITQDLTEMQVDETEDEKAKRNREAAATLFGAHHENEEGTGLAVMGSPLVRPVQPQGLLERSMKREGTADVEMRDSVSIAGDGGFGVGWDVGDPESIELEELDDLLGGF